MTGVHHHPSLRLLIDHATHCRGYGDPQTTADVLQVTLNWLFPDDDSHPHPGPGPGATGPQVDEFVERSRACPAGTLPEAIHHHDPGALADRAIMLHRRGNCPSAIDHVQATLRALQRFQIDPVAVVGDGVRLLIGCGRDDDIPALLAADARLLPPAGTRPRYTFALDALTDARRHADRRHTTVCAWQLPDDVAAIIGHSAPRLWPDRLPALLDLLTGAGPDPDTSHDASPCAQPETRPRRPHDPGQP